MSNFDLFYLFYRIKPSMVAKMEKFSARLVAPRMLAGADESH